MDRRQFLKRLFSFGSFGFLASYPTIIERYAVLTNRYRIEVPNLPKAFSGFRIVHLTDLHYGLFIPLGLVAAWLQGIHFERDRLCNLSCSIQLLTRNCSAGADSLC